MLTTRPRGTNDILPGEVEKWQYIEEIARQVSGQFGYHEIRTPLFEHTELFLRGVGETTDIVEKEMYSFEDRGKRNITLRPEGTASTVRAFLENKLYANPQPTKLFYIGPMFRYDRPQAGRYRQFHQFGIEVFGSHHPSVDAEVIGLACEYLERLGLNQLKVHINTVGCPKCRPQYREALIKYFQDKKDILCKTCLGRLEKNPLRILDCKNTQCQELSLNAPTIQNSTCSECQIHFQQVQNYLDSVGIEYIVNPKLVRGLDYYTHTAFEILVQGIGAQSAICGGGRYNGLIEQCGGKPTPGIGFAMGMERLLLTLELQGISLIANYNNPEIYIATVGEETEQLAFRLAMQLRKKGISVEKDYLDKSLKAQMKTADRLNVKYTLIIGEEEFEKNQVTIRNMATSQQNKIPISDIISYIERSLRGK
ncbi:MAG: histidyl-tRNA synthetase [Clostridia bacterium]|jgi:histidyl-tRNA synthetase|nr:histidyl-tRNA synthetase [Clostridia bacterium]MDN5323189.1 histidyl-tRNA synthetase [Clostridia bacterium]